MDLGHRCAHCMMYAVAQPACFQHMLIPGVAFGCYLSHSSVAHRCLHLPKEQVVHLLFLGVLWTCKGGDHHHYGESTD